MQQAKKPAAETKTERDGTLRLINKGRIVQTQLANGRFQMLEVADVDRINSAEHHRMNFLKAGQRLPRRIALIGDRVADFHVGDGLDVRDKITDVARV